MAANQALYVCAGTVFVAYAKKDSNDFTSPFIEEAEKLKLKIRTVDTFSLQCSTDPDWDSSPVPDKIRKYIRESICFVWIFSPAFLQDKKAAISSDADCEADSIPKLVDIIFDNFVVHGDAKYSSARMFTICHHTTREQLRDTDCVMASYAPLDSSCGPFIAAQLLKIKVEGKSGTCSLHSRVRVVH